MLAREMHWNTQAIFRGSVLQVTIIRPMSCMNREVSGPRTPNFSTGMGWKMKRFFDSILAMTQKMSRSDNKIGTQEGSSATAASTLIQKFNWSSVGSADSKLRGDSSQTPSHGFNQAAAVSEFQSSPGTLSWFFQRSVAMSEREMNAMAPLSS